LRFEKIEKKTKVANTIIPHLVDLSEEDAISDKLALLGDVGDRHLWVQRWYLIDPDFDLLFLGRDSFSIVGRRRMALKNVYRSFLRSIFLHKR